VAEDRVAAGLAAQQQAVPAVAERAVSIVGEAGRGTAAIDVAGGDDPRIVLAPFGHRHGLAGALVGAPLAFAVGGEEAEAAALDEVADAAGGRGVVVVEEHLAERGGDALVAVAVVV